MAGPVTAVARAATFFYDPDPSFGHDPRTFVTMMVVGFLVGIAGHIVRSRTIVAIGIGLVFLATFLLPLATNVLEQ